jgi:uncharacterized protein YbjQ (UPF0145 family)
VSAIDPESVVTFDRPDGYRVVASYGNVRGEAITPRNFLRATFRSLGAFIGFTPVEYLTDAERGRSDCLRSLRESASLLGANGVVGVQFEACELSDGSTRVSAVGEAVLLEPETRAS